MTFKTLIEKLKEWYGMHHGLGTILMILPAHLYHPMIGMAVAIYMTGYFDGREVREAQTVKWSNNPLVIMKNIEWADFVTPKFISLAYVAAVVWGLIG